jgi:DNA repair exonuclease SbcCD nuclease subunit
VEIIDYPRSIGGFLFVPYVAPGRFEEALRKCPQPGRVSAIFCHQEFNGVQVGPHQSVKGDRWPQDWPLVISGHIHERQWLQANLLYVGSPYQINFGEEDDKSVTLLDFVEGKSFPEHRFFNLGMPLRITKTLSIEEAREYIAPENAKVRIYLTGTTEELSAFKKSKKYKEMEKLFRIIPKPTDKISVQRNTAGRNFMELLTESLASESRAVQDTFAEIMDAHKA